jgi:hypothetical protein
LAGVHRAAHTQRVGWQDVVVAAVVLGALGYLGARFVGPRKKPKSGRPDVAVGSLVRRRTDGEPPR